MGYFEVVIDEKKEYKDYTSTERRSVILKLMIERGHPKSISLTSLSKQFGVSVPMISKDIKTLQKDICKEIPSDFDSIIHLVFNKSIKKLLNGTNKDLFNAAKLCKLWGDFLFDSGIKNRAPSEIRDVTDRRIDEIWKEIKEEENSKE